MNKLEYHMFCVLIWTGVGLGTAIIINLVVKGLS